jgi:hypothetical protein
MNFQQRLSALITSIKSETKSIRSFVTGTASGDATGLNTTSTNLVDAINEIRATAESAGGGGGSSVDDASSNTTDAWSGSKVASSIATAITNALEGEDLSEVADAIAAAAAERADLATSASVDTLSATVANKANSSDIYTQTQLGNPDTDLVTLWNAA